MALAKKCDICGKLYEIYGIQHNSKEPNGYMLLNVDCQQKYFTGSTVDCCPDCVDSILHHIQRLKEMNVKEENND